MDLRHTVHNFIHLTNEGRKLIVTFPLQRINGIRKRAMANPVYPRALHPGFDHTLGMMHVAGFMTRQLGANPPDWPQPTRFNPVDDKIKNRRFKRVNKGKTAFIKPQSQHKPTGLPLKGRPIPTRFHPVGMPHRGTLPKKTPASPINASGRLQPDALRKSIRSLCRTQPLRAAELAAILGRNTKYLKNQFLHPMVIAGELCYLYPANPAHPRQAYKTATRTGQTTKKKDGV